MGEETSTVRARWTRRQVQFAGGAGAAVLGLSACGGSVDRTFGVATPGAPFTQPKVLASTDGRIEATLRAEPGSVPYGDGTRFAYTHRDDPGAVHRNLRPHRLPLPHPRP